MKFPQALLSFATLAVFSIPSFAASTTWVTIKDNPGGYVHEYRSTYRDYKRKGVNVRIDWECRPYLHHPKGKAYFPFGTLT
jgi:hypothetical protein